MFGEKCEFKGKHIMQIQSLASGGEGNLPF